MICDLCKKNEAVIFLEAIGNGGKRKLNLCVNCAASRGISTRITAPDVKNIESIFEEIKERDKKNNEDFSRLCPVCGKSLGEIKKNGIAGCPECYETFRNEITAEIKKFGDFEKYSGSMPKRLAHFRNSLTDRADLQAKLEEAVESENYEKAAVYRDFMRALEHGSVARGSVTDSVPEEDFSDSKKGDSNV